MISRGAFRELLVETGVVVFLPGDDVGREELVGALELRRGDLEPRARDLEIRLDLVVVVANVAGVDLGQ